jgi:3-dehydroquinate synthase
LKVNIDFKNQPSKNYSVFVDELNEIVLDTKVAIVTNTTVAKLHLDEFLPLVKAKEVHVITVQDGEQYKNFETINYILDEMFKAKLDRKSTLIAFGGGVVGDMTGFTASIFQRGIDFIQVPTTLLSQVDASVGGKTGINNSFGKNLVGAFHQPRAVYCESKFLKTLPKREFAAGVAEIVKMAVTFDKEFFDFLEKNDLNNDNNLRKAIAKCVEIKADVVAKDETEQGIRSVLNYGHTFGHVIENQTKYSKYLHGEAVAMGIVMANNLATKLNLLTQDEASKIKQLLEQYSLPTTYELKDSKDFYEGFFLDKKTFNNKIKFILANGIGDFKIVDDVSKTLVLESINNEQ